MAGWSRRQTANSVAGCTTLSTNAALPYGYTLAAGSGSAVLATAHGRFGTVQALMFLLGRALRSSR